MFIHRISDTLELRLYQEHHAPQVFAGVDANREHLRQWLPWVDNVKAVDDSRDFIRRSLEQLARGDGFQAGIWDRGQYVGGVGLHYVNHESRKTEIGYWLAESAQGRGIMTKACKAVVDYAFNELGLNRVEIRCADGNRRSRAIPERLKFTQEGVLRQSGFLYEQYVDLVVYAMLADEWKQRREG